jgi:hypothetical protein
MSNVDLMVDIETLGTSPNSSILVIGAVKFQRNGNLKPLKELDTFYRRIILNSCLDLGLKVDKETLEWWDKQDSNVRYEALENPDRIPLRQALIEFSTWMKPCNKVWANSPSFDCVILESAYKACNIPIPWNFWNTRDCRTLFDLANIRKYDLPDNDQHNAIHDCYRQIVGVKRAISNLGI